MSPRRKAADLVIIGGGAVGASILYHLTKLGLRNVLLLEKGELSSGSTGQSAAIVRQHYSNDVSIKLVKKSLEMFQSFGDEFGDEKVFNRSGWLFLCPPEASHIFEENLNRLKDSGVRTWEIDQTEANEMLPGLNYSGVGKIAFEPDSGYADPVRMVSALVARSKEAGAEVLVNTPATGIRTQNGQITAVTTPEMEISTRVVVNAAGPWAKEIGKWTGIDLPLEISREQDVVLRAPPDTFHLKPAISNMVDRTYLRPLDKGLILVGTGHPKTNDPADPNRFNHNADVSFIEDVTQRLVKRFPLLADSSVVSSWAGLYTITPDWNMIIDRATGMDGMYLAVGGSGHSFKLSPAIGLCLAEMIIDGKASTVDITAMRASRFAENIPLRSTYGGNRG
jgi:sarcosine oxidase subunit beta